MHECSEFVDQAGFVAKHPFGKPTTKCKHTKKNTRHLRYRGRHPAPSGLKISWATIMPQLTDKQLARQDSMPLQALTCDQGYSYREEHSASSIPGRAPGTFGTKIQLGYDFTSRHICILGPAEFDALRGHNAAVKRIHGPFWLC